MTIYFYLSIFIVTIFSYIFVESKKINIDKNEIFKFLSIVLIFISSFRWGVGGDWETYLYTYERSNINFVNFSWSFIYELTNFIFSSLGTGIYGVNLFVSSIFFIALYRFGKLLNFDLLLILLISFSLVFFNGIMGYVRQTLSLVFFIFSLELFLRNKKDFSLAVFLIAVFTHLSSIIFLPIYFYSYFKNIKVILAIVAVSIMTVLLGFNILKIAFNEFVFKGMISLGASFRSITLIICCFIYLFYRKKLYSSFKNLKFITDYLFILSVFLIGLIFLSSAFSAIADRLSLFMVIFQIIIIGQFFNKVIKSKNKNYIHHAIFISVLYYLITFSWFIFGDYSIYWLDYNFMYFE